MAGELGKELIKIWEFINEIHHTLKIITPSEMSKTHQKLVSNYSLGCFADMSHKSFNVRQIIH